MDGASEHRPSPELWAMAEVAVGAMPLARALWHQLRAVPPIVKSDGSQVTVADYAVQAVVVHGLQQRLGRAEFMCEESAAQLHACGRPDVEKLVGDAVGAQRMLTDRAPVSGDTWWLIDPIDGTAGFIAGEHFSICLAKIVRGVAVASVVACPRLRASGALDAVMDGPGCAVMAEAGRGAWVVTEECSAPRPLVRPRSWEPPLRWARSMNRRNLVVRAQPAVEALHVPVVSLPIDSQCKYALLAMNRADLALRLPGRSAAEHGWDHVAGALAVAESGAVATDICGAPLRTGADSLMSTNQGVLCAPAPLHAMLLPHLAQFTAARSSL